MGVEVEIFGRLFPNLRPKDLEEFFAILCEQYRSCGPGILANDFEMGATPREKAGRWIIEDDESLKREGLPVNYCMSLPQLNRYDEVLKPLAQSPSSSSP